METKNIKNKTELIELKAGLVIMCLNCSRRRVIDDWWLEKITKKENNYIFSLISSRLTCTCGAKGKAILTHPKLSREDFLNLYKLLKAEKINIKKFAEEIKALANEGNPLASHWLKNSKINKQLEEEHEKQLEKNYSNRRNAKYNTKQWLDWDLGISSRQGKRNRMYE